MNRYLSSSLAALALTLTLPLAVAAQDWKGPGIFKGRVVDDAGAPIKNAVVTMRMGSLKDGPKESKTNGKGEFEVKNLKTGDWTIEAKAEKFAIRKMRVNVGATATATPIDVKLINFEALQGQIAKANELFQANKNAEARAEYEQMLAKSPELTELHRMIAYTYGKEGNHAKALEHIEKMLDAEREGNTSGLMQMNISPAEAKNQLLILALDSATKINNEEKITQYLKEIDDTALIDPAELVNVAIWFMNRDKYPEAVALLDRTQKAFPDSPLHLFYRGMAMLRQKDTAAAKGHFEQFVSQAQSLPAYAAQVKQAQDYISKIK
ncbi:MAG: tetratricopeptide repeat protein [Vicinamibacterales bacterium]